MAAAAVVEVNQFDVTLKNSYRIFKERILDFEVQNHDRN